MKLLKSIIEKKLFYFDSAEINDKVKFWAFYQILNICGKLNKKSINLRNELWNQIINGNKDAEIKLKILINKDRTVIYQYLKKVEEQIDDKKILGNYYKLGRIAIADYEY